MDMQHREHSKHNEYTFGWIFIQEIYLITWLSIICCLLGKMTHWLLNGKGVIISSIKWNLIVFINYPNSKFHANYRK